VCAITYTILVMVPGPNPEACVLRIVLSDACTHRATVLNTSGLHIDCLCCDMWRSHKAPKQEAKVQCADRWDHCGGWRLLHRYMLLQAAHASDVVDFVTILRALQGLSSLRPSSGVLQTLNS
jgi:hypothetical protein